MRSCRPKLRFPQAFVASPLLLFWRDSAILGSRRPGESSPTACLSAGSPAVKWVKSKGRAPCLPAGRGRCRQCSNCWHQAVLRDPLNCYALTGRFGAGDSVVQVTCQISKHLPMRSSTARICLIVLCLSSWGAIAAGKETYDLRDVKDASDLAKVRAQVDVTGSLKVKADKEEKQLSLNVTAVMEYDEHRLVASRDGRGWLRQYSQAEATIRIDDG